MSKQYQHTSLSGKVTKFGTMAEMHAFITGYTEAKMEAQIEAVEKAKAEKLEASK